MCAAKHIFNTNFVNNCPATVFLAGQILFERKKRGKAFPIDLFFIPMQGVGLRCRKSTFRCRICNKLCCTWNQCECLLFSYVCIERHILV